MSQQTSIEWTDLSWNPVHGCSIVSTECRNCYAQTLSLRYKQTLKPWTPANAAENVILKPRKLDEPLRNTKDWRGLGDAARRAGKTDGKLVFVNSMSDLFHEQIPDDYIAKVFAVMAKASRHDFQVLTKRPDRMRDWCREYQPDPLPNVWLGTSVGLRHFVGRADYLRDTPAAVRFISAEPLLGPIVAHTEDAAIRYFGDARSSVVPQLDLTDIDWLIAGGESGADHRPMDLAWVRDLRDACIERDTAFFYKQPGGARPGGDRLLDGRTWDEFPQLQAVAA